MFKTTGLQVRKDGLTHAQYLDHWLHVHAPMAEGVEGLRGYISNEVLLAGSDAGVAVSHPDFGKALDGIAQLHFDTADGIARMAEAPKVQEWFADGPNFVGLRTGFVVEEHVVRSPGAGPDRLSHKAFAFLRQGTGAYPMLDGFGGELVGGFICSRVEAVTGSTNLPGFELPEIGCVVELWGHDLDDSRNTVRSLAAILPMDALVGVVLTRERVLRQPVQ